MAALLLLVLAAAMLFVGGDVTLGVGGPSARLAVWPNTVLMYAALLALGIAAWSKPARMPSGTLLLAVSAGLAVLGPTDALSFYDPYGVALGVGAASLVALWLVSSGRPTRRRWWDDPYGRSLGYLTLGVLLIPAAFGGVAAVSCARHGDDDLCAMAGFVFGLPAAVVAWLVIVVACELAAARRRRLGERGAGAVHRSG